MKKLILLALAVLGLGQLPAFAQQSMGFGFIGGTFGGPAGDGAFRYGIGGDWRVIPMVTMGGEIGGVADGGSGVVFSGNASIHVPVRPKTFDPFFTGGLSIGREAGLTGVWANLGGGLNDWVTHHYGARVEFRGYPGGYHLRDFAEFRIGFVFKSRASNRNRGALPHGGQNLGGGNRQGPLS